MRLRNALALGVTAATTGTAVLALAVGPSSADPAPNQPSGADAATRSGAGSDPHRPAPTPACGKATDPGFPIDTRIHGGPTTYVPGAGFRTFQVDLTNTTAEPCRGIHPVLVLADRDRALQPAQIRLEFYDSEARRWRPVAFEGTEEDENVGVFSDVADLSGLSGLPGLSGDAGGPPFVGFDVPAGRTVTVPVRLAFREDAAPNEVVANAAIVQRQGDDGDWVGESGDYRLAIATDGAEEEPESDPAEATPPRGDTGIPRPPALDGPELAQSGRESAAPLVPVAGALLLTGAGLLAATRRRRPRRP
ncbi:LPXTG cell wall anchor domain-containing protein [Streptomyces sp. NPDC054975]